MTDIVYTNSTFILELPELLSGDLEAISLGIFDTANAMSSVDGSYGYYI